MNNLNLIQETVIWILPVLLAIIVHEVAHGWVANLRGDSTALMLGRLTLNPFKHIDFIGTIVIPLICVFTGGIIFGWAKPVPINSRHFKHFRTDNALVAIAGPISNLLMAIIWATIIKITILFFPPIMPQSSKLFVTHMGYAGITVNVFLMILNLVPIPPLDGSKVAESVLPPEIANIYKVIAPYGFIILLILMYTNTLTTIIEPPFSWIQQAIFNCFTI